MGLAADNPTKLFGLSRTAIFVVLTAYFLRALVPAGWMPAVLAGDSGNYIVICTVSGLKTIPVDAEGKAFGGDAPRDSHHDGGTCDFGVAPKLALLGVDIVSTSSSKANASRAHMPAQFRRAAEDLHAPYAPRAPPSFI